MRSYLPPSTPRILARIADRNARRLRRIRRSLHPVRREHREALAALGAALRSWSERDLKRFLIDPAVRSWLHLAEDASSLTHPPGDDTRWFDWLADTPYLARVLPFGRIDRGARGRARRLGLDLRVAALHELPLLLTYRPPSPSRRFGPFTPAAGAPGGHGDEERLPGEILIPFPRPARLVAGGPVRLELTPSGARVLRAPKGKGNGSTPWAPLATIPGSDIVLTRLVVSRRRGGVAARGEVPGLAGRFGRALDLIRESWGDAAREITTHTRRVIPLREKGTVSYSRRVRPGVSYITFEGKSTIDLADDLLHETAHHRLHALEEIGPLERDDGEPRYGSPWRDGIRPVRGLLHAAYTFTYRAELFSRLVAIGKIRGIRGRLPRRWLRAEISREIASLREALADLRDAQRRGLLTPRGIRLRAAIAARVDALR